MKIHIIYLGIFNIKLLTLHNCQKDITSHWRYWKGGGGRICAKEADLLLCRSGLFDIEKSCRRLLLICWGHRDSLGSTGNHVPRISANIRYVTMEVVKQFNVSKEIWFPFQVILPVGNGKSQFEFPLIFCKIVFIEPDSIV